MILKLCRAKRTMWQKEVITVQMKDSQIRHQVNVVESAIGKNLLHMPSMTLKDKGLLGGFTFRWFVTTIGVLVVGLVGCKC